MRKFLKKQILLRPGINFGILLIFINVVPPHTLFSFVFFYILLAVTLFFFLRLFLDRLIVLVTVSTICAILILRQLQLLNIITLALLVSLYLTLVLFVRENNRHPV